MKALVASALLACTSLAAAAKPNIVWVMSDDMGWGEVGLYPAGSIHGRIATPNLDKFGNEGMVFRQAYAGYTVCAPSRTTLFTGRHSGNFVKHGLAGTNIPVTQNAFLLSEMLQNNGYATGAFGKIAPLAAPASQGFDTFFGQISQVDCHNMYPEVVDSQLKGSDPFKVNCTLNWKAKNRTLCMANPSEYNYTIDMFENKAFDWLETVAGGEKPFFLYLSFTVPHAGGWTDKGSEQGAPVPSDGQYNNQSWPDVERDHAAVVTYLDGKVGHLMSLLEKKGVDDNTLVFFASDNGAHLEGGHSYTFFNSTGGLLGHKRSLYEGGVRSPSMVRWPGTIKPAVSEFRWAFWDVLPTIADLIGSTEQIPTDLDGISILDTLMGKKQTPKEYLYFTWDGAGRVLDTPEMWESGKGSGYGLVMGDMKGVVPFCADETTLKPSLKDPMALYNLSVDPFETTNIAAQHADIVTSMITFIMKQNVSCQCFQC
eukprot:TRINITY_DN1320_c0_g1_i2.p1 TRINITY_DN1320_c0_g1~~TRINITY_DN1320_c0_g1_i2.p1  ORF type:complete len:498 (+),score=132.82 TRINITY_DN1320_c0_g1_i2:47-1495(+)